MNSVCSSQSCTYSAKVFSISPSEKMDISFTYSTIILINSGEIHLEYLETEEKVIKSGQMFFLPSLIKCKVTSIGSVEGLILGIPDPTALCHLFFPVNIVPSKKDVLQFFSTLPVTSLIEKWVKSVEIYLEDDRYDSSLIEIKTLELFYLLRSCYKIDDLSLFFKAILQEDYKFTLFVLSNYSSVKTAEELARLSNYSFSGFDKQFRRIFGMPPYRWMLQKKTGRVYREIYETTKPLKIIADECGFSGLSQLSDFCRKHFGISPVSIRNKWNRQEL